MKYGCPPAAMPSPPTKDWRVYAVGLSAGAGIIHWTVTPEHFAHWWGYGLFFLVAGAAQVAYAVWLASNEPSRRWLIVGLLGNGLIIVLYLITRTVGIPFLGPSAGEIEPVGRVDVISKATELALMACLALMLRARRAAVSEHASPCLGESTMSRTNKDE